MNEDFSINKRVNDYIKNLDWRVKENASVNYSFSNLQLLLVGHNLAKYGLNNIYNEIDISNMHEEGIVHIHDLSGSIAPYCAGWSLKDFINKGFKGSKETISSKPPKNMTSLVGQMINFLGCISNEWMGAQAFSDVDIYLSGYMMKELQYIFKIFGKHEQAVDYWFDRMSKEIKSLIYSLNVPSRWGGQPPFSNFTLDLTVPPSLKDEFINIGDEFLKVGADFIYYYNNVFRHKILHDYLNQDSVDLSSKLSIDEGILFDSESGVAYLKYKNIKPIINMFNYIFFKEIGKGDKNEKGFTFPVITINQTEEFYNLPKNLLDTIIDTNIKYGTTYFQNCINGESNCRKIDPDANRSMCCRLQIDVEDIKRHTGGLFGNGEYVGSIGVITLNLPMLGYLSNTKNEFFNKLKYYMEEVRKALKIKRRVILDLYEKGLFSFTKEYLKTDFSTHFLTFGYIGLHETIKNFVDYNDGILSKEGYSFSIEVLDFMRELINKYQEEDSILYNLEATPAEGASYRLAKKLKEQYPDSIVSGSYDNVYLTNSCHPPVSNQGDLFDLTIHQENLQKRHTGGTVVHFYMDSVIENKKQYLEMLKFIGKSKIPYYTITPIYSVCPICGYIKGFHLECPNNHTKEELEELE